MKFVRKFSKAIALFCLVNLLIEIVSPAVVLAVTGHSSMPEYRSFEPVATTNMVNNFDGSFTYNIPLLEIPNGYPISLSYHSNEVNNEAQASWVGLGWTLNPGAINRVKRGFPDEFDGQEVTYHTRAPKNWTLTAGTGASGEILSKGSDEKMKSTGISLSMDGSIRYNNYQGFSRSVSTGVSLAGMASLNFSYNNGRFGFSPEINPAAIMQNLIGKSDRKNKRTEKQKKEAEELAEVISKEMQKDGGKGPSEQGMKNLQKMAGSMVGTGGPNVGFSIGGLKGGHSSQGSSFSVAPNPPTAMPVSVNPYAGTGLRLKVEVGINFLPFPIDPEGRVSGSYVQQTYQPINKVNVAGYMNSESAVFQPAMMMDYMTENEQMYDKKDKYLSVPFPNNDIFSLSGEALGGSFRAFRSEMGTYRKNKAVSETVSFNGGADINIASIATLAGTSNIYYSVGANLGGDYNRMEVGEWGDDKLVANRFLDEVDYKGLSDEKFILRFSGDKSTNLDLTGGDDNPVATSLNDSYVTASVGTVPFVTPLKERNLRSSYVEMLRNSDFVSPNNTGTNSIPHRVSQKNLTVLSNGYEDYNSVIRNSEDFKNGIGEITTYNADGLKYVYGLPLHTRNEKEIQYSVESDQYSVEENGLIASVNYSDIDAKAKRKVGYESSAPYATQFLITQITSPDYIDRTMNGPSKDDFGAYTRFNYTRIAGGTGSWYSYRNPYKDASFSYGSLSSKQDDMAGYSFGEKEIYFLQSIASKTHVAIFVLDSRLDGQSAKVTSNSSAFELLTGNSTAAQTQLKKLKRIELYSINQCNDVNNGFYTVKSGELPIKTINFEYGYDLFKGSPNSTATGAGRLTLKKVWYEYGGKVKHKLTPYEFFYDYFTGDYPAPYNDAQYGINKYGNDLMQFPGEGYKVENTDRWGNYRYYSNLTDRIGDLARFFPYVYQAPYSIDPALGCLKRIKLPSGGQIHIQYEQNDYLHVQDKRAMAMVPLSTGVEMANDDEGNGKKKYYLNLDHLGITDKSIIYLDLAHQLFEPMLKDRMYFNFLYRLVGGTKMDVADFKSVNSEYIEGYARISGYGVENPGTSSAKIYFVFKSIGESDANYQKIDHGKDFTKRELPCNVCDQFYMNNRQGMISNENNSLEDDKADNESRVKALLSTARQITGTIPRCQIFNPGMSYVRLQLPVLSPSSVLQVFNGIKGKLGGGVRVKRLLMYEDGMLSDPSLYGVEYDYTTLMKVKGDVIRVTTGVATNEPAMGRRENTLVNPLERNHQSKFEAILFGRDMYDSEGPLGESLLPSPSIGYSKVTIKSIHQGSTSTGYEVQEFYTCKDFPFKVIPTDLQRAGDIPVSVGGGYNGIGGTYSRKAPSLAQGYSFIQNEMHGQIKRIAKYSNGSEVPVADEMYDYVPPGETVDVMDENLNVQSLQLGKESEILAESREVYEVTTGGSFGADISAGVLFSWPTPPVAPLPAAMAKKVRFSAFVNENILRTHVITKIVKYPAIVKKVTNISDGVKHVSENLVFDKFSGNPVVVKSYDDFSQNVMSQDFMASWAYKNMRSKSLNEGSTFKGIFQDPDGTLTGPDYLIITGGENCSGLDKFTRGDFLELTPKTTGKKALYHVRDIDYPNNRLVLISSALANSVATTTGSVDVEIISSGYTNQLTTKAGNIVSNNNTNYVKADSYTSEDAAAKQLATQLNDKVSTGGTILWSSLPDGLRITDPVTKACINPKADPTKYNFVVSSSTADNGSVTVKITNQSGADLCSNVITLKCNVDNNWSAVARVSSSGEGGNFPIKVIKTPTECINSASIRYNTSNASIEMFNGTCWTPLSCIPVCRQPFNATYDKVVTASAAIFTDNWAYDNSRFKLDVDFIANANEYETGTKGKWRTKETYTYRTVPSHDKNYNTGIFTLELFNWKNPEYNSSKWVKVSTVDKYSPSGQVMEDHDILGTYSTAKYGYGGSLPVLVAQNATDQSVIFESFENVYLNGSTNYLEDGVSAPSIAAVPHTGGYSAALGASLNIGTIKGKVNAKIPYVVRAWFKAPGTPGSLESFTGVKYVEGSETKGKTFKYVSSAGEWQLYEAIFDFPVTTSGVYVSIFYNGPANSVYLDDVRMQPLESQMTCYVYDSAQRLTAVLDDRHYAMIYQYNDEGLLVRKLKETRDGVKTLSETQYNTSRK